MTFSDATCCLFLILIGALIVAALIRSRKKKAASQEEIPVVEKDPEEYLLLGKQNLELGNRQAAVKNFIHVYRHGWPNLREQAIRALEEIGEVETF